MMIAAEMLCRESMIEKEILHEVAVVRKHNDVISDNRKHREDSYEEQRLVDDDQRRDADAHVSNGLTEEFARDAQIATIHFERSLQRRRDAKRREVLAFCSEIVNKTIDFAVEIVRYRDDRFGRASSLSWTRTSFLPPSNSETSGLARHARQTLNGIFRSDQDMDVAFDVLLSNEAETNARNVRNRVAVKEYLDENVRAERITREAFRTPEDHVREIFQRFDRDKSGVIERKDLREVLKELHVSCCGKNLRRILARLDKNESGQIDFDELYSWLSSSVLRMSDIVDCVAKSSAVAELDTSPATKKTLAIIVCGGPFSGKSHVAKKLADTFDLALLNVDDMIAATVAEGGASSTKDTPSEKIRHALLSGETISDELLAQLVSTKIRSLEGSACVGCVLDGFPETASQAAALERTLSGFTIDQYVADRSAKASRLWFSSQKEKDDDFAPPSTYFDAVIRIESDGQNEISRAVGTRVIPGHKNNIAVHLSDQNGIEFGDGSVRKLVKPRDLYGSRANVADRLARDVIHGERMRQWFSMFDVWHSIDTSPDRKIDGDGAEAKAFSADNDVTTQRANDIVREAKARLDARRHREHSATEARELEARATAERFETLRDVVGTYVYEPTKADVGAGMDPKPLTWTVRLSGIAESPAGDEIKIVRSDADTLSCEDATFVIKLRRNVKSDDDDDDDDKTNSIEPIVGFSVVPIAGESDAELADDETTTSENEKTSEKSDSPDTLRLFARATVYDPPSITDSWFLASSRETFDVSERAARYLDGARESTEKSFFEGLERIVSDLHVDSVRRLRSVSKVRNTFVKKLDVGSTVSAQALSQFQSQFNEIPQDVRHEQAIKEELHLRVTELCDRLRSDLDTREEEAKETLTSLSSDDWLKKETALTLTRIAQAMQLEVNRFWETCVLVRDFENVVRGNVVAENEPFRVADGENASTPDFRSDFGKSLDESSDKETRTGSKKKTKSKSKSAKSNKGGKKNAVGGAKKKDANRASDESTVDPYDPILALVGTIVDTLSRVTPTLGIDNLGDVRPTSSTEEIMRAIEAFDPVESAMRRKNPSNVMLEQRSLHFVLILSWWLRKGRARVDALHDHTRKTMEHLDTLLNERFEQEKSALNTLERLVRDTIERENDLPFELRLDGVVVVVDETKRIRPETPRPPPSEIEAEDPIAFSPRQLVKLAKSLSSASRGVSLLPTGMVRDVLMRSTFAKNRELPLKWESLNEDQWMRILRRFDVRDSGFVSWRRILVAMALTSKSISYPSLDELRRMRVSFLEAGNGREYVTRRELDLVDLWYDANDSPLATTKEFFWHTWSNAHGEMYVSDVLLGICADATAESGLRRAFAIDPLSSSAISQDDVERILSDDRGLTESRRRGLLVFEDRESSSASPDDVLAAVMSSDGKIPDAFVSVDLALALKEEMAVKSALSE